MSQTIAGRVLVVDDELQLMEVLVEALNSQGYAAQGFLTGVAAVEALQKQEFDLLLTDLMMPEMDGITLLKACLAIDPHLVGIVMTGQGTVPTAVEAMKTGAFDYVLKPFRLEMLLPVLKRAMEVRQLRLENIQLRETVAIYNLSQTIAHALDSKHILEDTAEAAQQQLDADEVSIMLLTQGRDELYIAALRGKAGEYLAGQRISLQAGIAGWVARQKEPLILNGEVSDARFAPIQPRPEIRSAICVPMMTAGKLVGVLNVNSLQPRRPFTAGQVKALSILTSAAAAALENGALYQTLEAREKRFRALIENISDAIMLVDAEGRIGYATPSIQSVLGYRESELQDRRVFELVHLDDLETLIRLFARLLTQPGSTSGDEVRVVTKDGAIRWVQVVATNLIEAPSVGAIVTVYRDITERRQVEEAVLESERQMRALVTSLDDIIFEFDEQGTYLNVWAADENLLARPKAQLLGRRIEDILGEVHGRPFSEAVKRVMASGHIESIEYALEVIGGERWFLARISPILTPNDSPGSVSMLVRDITERKEAEKALRESEIRFRSLIENSSDEISIVSADGKLMYETPTANPTLGYQPGEFLGQTLFQLIHPDDLERVQKQFARLIQDPHLHPRDQFRLRHQNGNWRWVEAVGTNLLSEPSVLGIVVNYHDITERKQAEENIEHQLQRLNALRAIDTAISSTFDIHVTLDIVLQHVLSQLGVDAAAVLLFNPELQTIEYAASRGFRSGARQHTQLKLGEGYASRVMLEGKTVHIPAFMESGERLAGSPHLEQESFIDYYGTPLITKGEAKGVLEIYHRSHLQSNSEWLEFLETLAGQAAIAIDNAQLFDSLQRSNAELEKRVTERTQELNRTNLELEHANRAKDEFLANMSHELRTPLNSILGMSETLLEQRRDPLSEYQQRSLQLVHSSGSHLLELINDILDLSKIEAGKFDYQPQSLSVDEICRSSMAFVKTQAAKKSITINYMNEASIPRIYADPRRLKQILVNLLTNAVKFTLENGQVILQIDTDLEQDIIRFSVIDTGIGIAPEDLKRLFQPFVQVDSSLNRQHDGTGLGLTLVQRLTDLHGGSVQVESEVGKGSRFIVSLPCRQNEVAEQETAHSQAARPTGAQVERFPIPAEGSGPRGLILLAEDNMPNILTIGEYLESYGYEVVVARDGLEAIKKAEAINPDIILMDIQMPVLNGLDAIARLRNNVRFAATPIIALTALAMPGDRERCLQAGASEYMSKPVSLKNLRQTISRFLQA